jgi:hypothetical protein
MTLVSLIYGESTEHDDRDWIGGVSPQSSRRLSVRHTAGGNTTITSNPAIRITHDIGPGGAPLASECTLNQPAIEADLSAGEPFNDV